MQEVKELREDFKKAVLNEDVDNVRKIASKLSILYLEQKAHVGNSMAVIEFSKLYRIGHKLTPEGVPSYNKEEIEILINAGSYFYKNKYQGLDLNDSDILKEKVLDGSIPLNEAKSLLAFMNQADEAKLMAKLEDLENKLK